MEFVLAAIIGALVTAVVGFLLVAPAEADRHDRQIVERDQGFEEWIVEHHRELMQRFHEIRQEATARGVAGGGAIPAGQAAVRTQLLYRYREELHQARSFVLDLEVQERWPHRLYRKLFRRPMAALKTPAKAERVIDYWQEGTDRNTLAWSLDDIDAELPVRATSRAREAEAGSG
jgi:hypothetical protein